MLLTLDVIFAEILEVVDVLVEPETLRRVMLLSILAVW